MDFTPALIAALVTVVVVLIIYYVFLRKKTHTPGGSPGGPHYVAQAPASVWDPSLSSAAYSCPDGHPTASEPWCIVPVAKAPALCSTDPKCNGYIVPDPSDGPWGKNYIGSAQLVNTPPVANADTPGTVYYKKVAS